MSQEASVAKVSQSDGSATIVPLNPSTRPRKRWEGDKRNIKSSLGQVGVFRHLSRVWRTHLTASEFSLLHFFLDQTVGWGQRSKKLTIRQITEGTPATVGTGMSRTQIKTYVKSLQEKGFIHVGEDKSTGLRVTPVLPWERVEKDAELLSIPKRLQEKVAEEVENDGFTPVENPTTPGRKTGHPQVGKSTPIVGEYLGDLDKGNSSCGSADADRDGWESFSETEETPSPQKTTSIPLGSVRKRIRPSAKNSERDVPAENFEPGGTDPLFEEDRAPSAPVRARSRPTAEQLAAERARKAEARRGRANPGAVAETFAEAFGLAFSEIEGMRLHSLTKVELGKLKQGLCKDWAGEPEQLHAFVDYCVANWTQIVAECFKWMTKKPAPVAPDLLFLNWQRNEFIDAWNHRARSSWLDKIEDVDRRRYNTLTKVRGMPHDAAVLQIAKEKAARETREETDAKLAEAKRHHATAQGLVKRREREEKAASLIHPDSPIMQDMAKLKAENERLRKSIELQRAAAKDGDILQPGANFEMPEWKDD